MPERHTHCGEPLGRLRKSSGGVLCYNLNPTSCFAEEAPSSGNTSTSVKTRKRMKSSVRASTSKSYSLDKMDKMTSAHHKAKRAGIEKLVGGSTPDLWGAETPARFMQKNKEVRVGVRACVCVCMCMRVCVCVSRGRGPLSCRPASARSTTHIRWR